MKGQSDLQNGAILQAGVDPEGLWEGELCESRMNGVAALVMRIDGELYSFENKCPHLGLPLGPNALCDGVLTCPYHGWTFDARTGKGINPRATCLKRVEIRPLAKTAREQACE